MPPRLTGRVKDLPGQFEELGREISFTLELRNESDEWIALDRMEDSETGSCRFGLSNAIAPRSSYRLPIRHLLLPGRHLLCFKVMYYVTSGPFLADHYREEHPDYRRIKRSAELHEELHRGQGYIKNPQTDPSAKRETAEIGATVEVLPDPVMERLRPRFRIARFIKDGTDPLTDHAFQADEGTWLIEDGVPVLIGYVGLEALRQLARELSSKDRRAEIVLMEGRVSPCIVEHFRGVIRDQVRPLIPSQETSCVSETDPILSVERKDLPRFWQCIQKDRLVLAYHRPGGYHLALGQLSEDRPES